MNTPKGPVQPLRTSKPSLLEVIVFHAIQFFYTYFFVDAHLFVAASFACYEIHSRVLLVIWCSILHVDAIWKELVIPTYIFIYLLPQCAIITLANIEPVKLRRTKKNVLYELHDADWKSAAVEGWNKKVDGNLW